MSPAVPSEPGAFDAVAWSWVRHLRQRGTRPWSDWITAPGGVADDGATGRLPGAAQLEVVRRLAGRPAAAAVPFEELADLVLGRGAPGRGPDDLPLVWPGDRPAGFGPLPVDPAGLPPEELVRVLVGVIAELLVRTPPRKPGRRRGADRSTTFPVAGAPAPAASVRAALAAAGHEAVEPPTTAVLLVEPVDRLLAQTWARRVRRGGIVPWPRYVDRWARQDRLPAPVDLPTVAAGWAERVGRDRVHLVALPPGQDALATARTTAAHVLGLSVAAPAQPGPLGPAQVELVRQVNQVLRGRVAVERHRRLLRWLVPRVAGTAPGRGVRLPARTVTWAESMSARLRERLRAGGYRLHGDLDALTVGPAAAAVADDEDLLSVALDSCLALAAEPATSVVLSAASSGAVR